MQLFESRHGDGWFARIVRRSDSYGIFPFEQYEDEDEFPRPKTTTLPLAICIVALMARARDTRHG
jgi:hypothetical protein